MAVTKAENWGAELDKLYSNIDQIQLTLDELKFKVALCIFDLELRHTAARHEIRTSVFII